MATNPNGITGQFDYGSSGDDTLTASPFGSVMYGYNGNDIFYGASGSDWFTGGLGADKFFGGSGYDAVDYSDSATGVMAGIGMGGLGGTADGDFIAADVEAIWASEHDDILFGSTMGDDLFGNGGNDQLFGNGGDDHLEGGAGSDILSGGSGADYLSGGSGFDTVSYADSGEGVNVFINGSAVGRVITANERGTAAGDIITDSVEAIRGSDFTDYMAGNDANNTLMGGKGSDVLSGYGGTDKLEGGEGADWLFGGSGSDTAVYKNSKDGVFVDLKAGSGTGGEAQGDYLREIENVEGSQVRDVIIGSSVDNDLYLNDGDDTASGEGGNDDLHGGNGQDFLTGDDGNDHLYGDSGSDILLGGAGDDDLNGGLGNDKMTGGEGADRFNLLNADLGSVDTIVDFSRAQGDKINLVNIDANTTLGGNQGFTFIGTAAFTHQAGQLHYVSDGLTTTLTGDVNGDALADFTIVLTGAPGLIATDFLL